MKSWSQCSILALGVALAVLVGCQPAQESASSGGIEAVPLSELRFPKEVFRLTFGLKDTKPEDWSGHLEPRDGQQLTVVPEHFRAGVYRHGFGDTIMTVTAVPDAPNDRLTGPLSWICSTTRDWIRYADRARIRHPSLFVNVEKCPPGTPVHVETRRGTLHFVPSDMPLFRSQYFLDGNVRVERVPPVSPAAAERVGQQDYPSLLSTRSGVLWMAWQEYHESQDDSVCVRWKTEEETGPLFVLARKADVFLTTLAEDSEGRVWAIWSMQVEGNWDLYARSYDGQEWSELQRLTDDAGPDINHTAITDSEGLLWLVWQRPVEGISQIVTRAYDGSRWQDEFQVSEGEAGAGNNWSPSLAAGPEGTLAIAWDGYAGGSYDIYLRSRRQDQWGPVLVVSGTERYEASPSVAIDQKGRVWVAWHESGIEWGKDTGRLVQKKGTELRESRWVRLACFDGDRSFTTEQDLMGHLGSDREWEMPLLQVDSSGNPWLLVRNVTKKGPAGRPRYFPSWEIHATRYRGYAWSETVRVQRSSGRNDMMPATAVGTDGRLWALWASDLRNAKSALPQQGRVFLSSLGAGGARSELALKSWTPEPTETLDRIHPGESDQVERIRSYRIQSQGKSYSIFRGDLHRHTDISLDGGGDGGLRDAYRYARDAAALDFIGVTDHDHEVAEPYAWWRSQKFADLLQQDSFTTFFSYERGIQFPNGHRNIVFTRRGVPLLPVLTGERLGLEGAERLFWYVRRHGGASIPHTIATGAGTDWRDNDPEVETLMEIYQGMRDTYEYPGAPRPKTLEATPTVEEDDTPYRRHGTAWSALDKGYRLGFIASSDHLSTHVSYACLIAASLSREDLMEAIRARRAYAATDNIILDVSYRGSDGQHLMGAAFSSSSPVRIRANILGTGTVKRVDVIRDGKILYTSSPAEPTFNLDFVDSEAPASGESYYYVRVLQEDGEIAWGSPAWITYRR